MGDLSFRASAASCAGDSSQTSICSQNPPQWSCWVSSSRCPLHTATSHIPTGMPPNPISVLPPHSPSHWQRCLLLAAEGSALRNGLTSPLALHSPEPTWLLVLQATLDPQTPLLPWLPLPSPGTSTLGSLQEPPFLPHWSLSLVLSLSLHTAARGSL